MRLCGLSDATGLLTYSHKDGLYSMVQRVSVEAKREAIAAAKQWQQPSTETRTEGCQSSLAKDSKPEAVAAESAEIVTDTTAH